jgi:hypothetical protein
MIEKCQHNPHPSPVYLLFTASQKEPARGALFLEAQASRAGWVDLETIREPESRCQMPRRASIICGHSRNRQDAHGLNWRFYTITLLSESLDL